MLPELVFTELPEHLFSYNHLDCQDVEPVHCMVKSPTKEVEGHSVNRFPVTYGKRDIFLSHARISVLFYSPFSILSSLSNPIPILLIPGAAAVVFYFPFHILLPIPG